MAFVARTAEAVTGTAWDTGAIGIVGEVGRNDDTHAIALQITGNLGGLNVLIKSASRGDGRGIASLRHHQLLAESNILSR